jgi:hypothetical protein
LLNYGSNCGYQVYGTESKRSHVLYIDDLKLIGRSEEALINEIKFVETINSDVKMKFGLEKCAKICLKSGKDHRKQYMENTMEIEI